MLPGFFYVPSSPGCLFFPKVEDPFLVLFFRGFKFPISLGTATSLFLICNPPPLFFEPFFQLASPLFLLTVPFFFPASFHSPLPAFFFFFPRRHKPPFFFPSPPYTRPPIFPPPANFMAFKPRFFLLLTPSFNPVEGRVVGGVSFPYLVPRSLFVFLYFGFFFVFRLRSPQSPVVGTLSFPGLDFFFFGWRFFLPLNSVPCPPLVWTFFSECWPPPLDSLGPFTLCMS